MIVLLLSLNNPAFAVITKDTPLSFTYSGLGFRISIDLAPKIRVSEQADINRVTVIIAKHLIKGIPIFIFIVDVGDSLLMVIPDYRQRDEPALASLSALEAPSGRDQILEGTGFRFVNALVEGVSQISLNIGATLSKSSNDNVFPPREEGETERSTFNESNIPNAHLTGSNYQSLHQIRSESLRLIIFSNDEFTEIEGKQYMLVPGQTSIIAEELTNEPFDIIDERVFKSTDSASI